ncbi:hypothetical protein DSO57_1032762 [Entomophthora muscae]|uniref:Uncharacterized protein n=1 Tax=Entomophthora muscae TaxID=34485 RepID=A0ACC2TB18_9FUNG|nr:hypothetical protein DSO57_1032762 [Entomophthora muscae]
MPMCKVLSALQHRNTSPGVISSIMSLFMNSGSKVAINSELTRFVPKKRGLFQGFILSPLLFDISIDGAALAPISAFLVDEVRNHIALFFADDIKIQRKNLLELQRGLTILSDWSRANGMSAINAKCGYIPVASGSRSTMLWNNTALSLMKLYTYLGFPHMANGIQVANLASAAANKVSALMSMFSGVAHSWTPLVWTTVYRTFFRFQMDYPLPLLFFANKFAKSPATTAAFVCLKKVHTQAMAWCTNISGQSLITSVITFIPTLANRVYHLATCFAFHVENLAFDNPLCLLCPT